MTWEEFCKTELGYEPKTTFWDDFSIADKFGDDAIKDTFQRAFNEWKNNYIYITELVMVLNHRGSYWYGRNSGRASLYWKLQAQADEYAVSHLQGEELDYYEQTLD